MMMFSALLPYARVLIHHGFQLTDVVFPNEFEIAFRLPVFSVCFWEAQTVLHQYTASRY